MLRMIFGSIAPGHQSHLGSISSGTRYLFSSLCLHRPHGFIKFRLYVGLLVNPTVYRKPAKGDQDGSPDIDDDDDDDGDNSSNIQTNTEDIPGQVPSSKSHAPSAYSVELGDADNDDDDEDTFRAPKTDTEEQREEKLLVFLNNPEKSVTIFLSSYMREQGLIWSVSLLPYAAYLSLKYLSQVREEPHQCTTPAQFLLEFCSAEPSAPKSIT